MKTQSIGILAALGATVIWSGNFIVASAIALDISALDLNFWRWIISVIIILPFALKPMCREWTHVWQHKWYLIFMAIIGLNLPGFLTYKAAQSTSSINMGLLAPSAPIFIMLLSRIIYSAPITPQRICSMVIILVGIFCIISKGDITNILSVQFNTGDILVLIIAFLFALYSLYIRQCPAEISLATFNGFTFLICALSMLPFIIYDYSFNGIPTFNNEAILGILYTGIGCSLLSFILWAKAVSLIGAIKAGFIYYSIPFFTVIGAYLFFGERITLISAMGGLCIIGGILAAILKQAKSNITQNYTKNMK